MAQNTSNPHLNNNTKISPLLERDPFAPVLKRWRTYFTSHSPWGLPKPQDYIWHPKCGLVTRISISASLSMTIIHFWGLPVSQTQLPSTPSSHPQTRWQQHKARNVSLPPETSNPKPAFTAVFSHKSHAIFDVPISTQGSVGAMLNPTVKLGLTAISLGAPSFHWPIHQNISGLQATNSHETFPRQPHLRPFSFLGIPWCSPPTSHITLVHIMSMQS